MTPEKKLNNESSFHKKTVNLAIVIFGNQRHQGKQAEFGSSHLSILILLFNLPILIQV